MSNSPEDNIPSEGSTETPIHQANPASGPPSPGNNAKTLVSDKEVSIKSKSTQNTISDSTSVLPEENENKPPVKYVNQKK